MIIILCIVKTTPARVLVESAIRKQTYKFAFGLLEQCKNYQISLSATDAMLLSVEGRYYMTAATVVLIFDIVLTLDVEIERVWRAKFTAAKLLFLIVRASLYEQSPSSVLTRSLESISTPSFVCDSPVWY